MATCLRTHRLTHRHPFFFNWVTGSPPNFDTLLASWYPTYMQSFIISHSSCAEQYGDMSSDKQAHTHTIKPPTAGVQLVGHASINKCYTELIHAVSLTSLDFSLMSLVPSLVDGIDSAYLNYILWQLPLHGRICP